MKVVLFGASGMTGKEIFGQALAKGHEVTAFVRDPAKWMIEQKNLFMEDHLHIVSGDVLDFSAVKQAVQGQEAVICSLGSASLAKTTVRSQGTANIIQAMEAEHVHRLIVVSAMGTGESWSSLSLANKLFYATLLRSSRQDHEAQELVVKKSNLEWTILRPSGLTNGALTGNYALGENVKGDSSRIARADVAHAAMKALDEKAYIHRAVTITN